MKSQERENLLDVTFMIPVRLDSEERRENIELILEYLNFHFQTHIMVCEESLEQELEYLKEFDCVYLFVKSDKPYIHRTRCLNIMCVRSQTPVICNFDTDVLLEKAQILEAVKKIRDKKSDGCFPFDGRFYDVPRNFYPGIRETKRIGKVDLQECRLLNYSSIGGALFWNKEKFIKGGMENEKFLGWGYEDNELLVRFQKLGLIIDRVDGVLYHLSHPRPSVSSFNSFRKIIGYFRNPLLKKNKREFNKVKSMTREDLLRYMEEWAHLREWQQKQESE
jgi:predicted glycosyltransferase involved in capsule biosynthesis